MSEIEQCSNVIRFRGSILGIRLDSDTNLTTEIAYVSPESVPVGQICEANIEENREGSALIDNRWMSTSAS